ncbi:MAG: hypothetical protein AB2693_34105 [Candidatus Thiodiazotropha sp.]
MTDADSLLAARNREIHSLWISMQDIIGNASKWPKLIRRLFWTRNLRHFQRCIVAAFVYVNGLNPDIFMEWAEKQLLCRDQAAFNHFRNLFKAFAEKKYKLYAYNVTNNRYEYIDGTVRVYQPAEKRQ